MAENMRGSSQVTYAKRAQFAVFGGGAKVLAVWPSTPTPGEQLGRIGQLQRMENVS